MSLKEEQKEKVRTNKHTTSKKKSKQKTTPKRKLSPTVKQQGMTLSDWQVALRRMAAKDEQMTVRCVDDRNLPGEYIVRSGKSQQQYKVVYRGAKSPSVGGEDGAARQYAGPYRRTDGRDDAAHTRCRQTDGAQHSGNDR